MAAPQQKVELERAQIIALVIVALVLTYFLTAVLMFALNGAMNKFMKLFTLDFTIIALVNGYKNAYLALLLAALLSFSLAFAIPYIPKKRKLYGDAKFANANDIRKLGLFPKKNNDGIIIGKYNGKLLRYGGQQFVALGAPTRSGKGVGIIIPNLLDYPNSCVVQDIKQECYEFTSKYREQVLGQEVFVFNPFSKNTHRYNPLYYINMDGDNADAELTDFGNILYPLKGDGSVTDYFNGKAKDLFIGLCYLMNDLLNTPRGLSFLEAHNLECDFSLYGILRLSEGLKFKIEEGNGDVRVIDNFADTYNTLVSFDMVCPKAKERIDAFFEIKSDNERSSAMGSFISPLSSFRADNMRLATSANDFDFRDLRRKKMTIYIAITSDKKASAKQILNIFWQQLILINVQQGLPQSNSELKHPCLLLMDEFTACGYLATYSNAISFMAGYDLRSLIAYQADSQLMTPKPEGYGREEALTLLANHACRIYYSPKLNEDAKKLSEDLGTTTVKNRSRNLGKGGGGSESDTSTPLMMAQELKTMNFKNEIILIDSAKPIFCEKAFYYKDKYFMDKFKQVSPSLAKIKGLPSQKQLMAAVQNNETRTTIPTQSEESTREWIYENVMKPRLEKFEDEFMAISLEYEEKMKNLGDDVEAISDEEIDKYQRNLQSDEQRS